MTWFSAKEDEDTVLAFHAFKNLAFTYDQYTFPDLPRNIEDAGNTILAINRLSRHPCFERTWVIREVYTRETSNCPMRRARDGGERTPIWQVFD